MSVSTLPQQMNYRKKVMHEKYWYLAKEKLWVISVFENHMVSYHFFVTVLVMIKTKGILRKLFHLILTKVHNFCFNRCFTVTYTTSKFQVCHNAQNRSTLDSICKQQFIQIFVVSRSLISNPILKKLGTLWL